MGTVGHPRVHVEAKHMLRGASCLCCLAASCLRCLAASCLRCLQPCSAPDHLHAALLCRPASAPSSPTWRLTALSTPSHQRRAGGMAWCCCGLAAGRRLPLPPMLLLLVRRPPTTRELSSAVRFCMGDAATAWLTLLPSKSLPSPAP